MKLIIKIHILYLIEEIETILKHKKIGGVNGGKNNIIYLFIHDENSNTIYIYINSKKSYKPPLNELWFNHYKINITKDDIPHRIIDNIHPTIKAKVLENKKNYIPLNK